GLALFFAASQAQLSLEYYQGLFLIQDGPYVFPVVTQAKPETSNYVRFRRGDTYNVWDKRGLSIRAGHWIYDTRFKELVVSPKLFSPDQIKANVASAARGERTLEASALAGSLRLGTDVYFLPRWIDKKGYTWLEALVRVDLSAATPKPQLMGRFDGMSLASGVVDNRLFALNDLPACVVRRRSDWGTASYDPLAEQFLFTNIGQRLKAYAHLEVNAAAYIEALDGGQSRVGVADLETGVRNDVLEDRGSIRILDTYRPLCAVVKTLDRVTLRNLQTSAALDLPPDAAVQRTPYGVLAWWPQAAPEHAILLDPARWEGVADWKLPAPDDAGMGEEPVPVKPPTRPFAKSRTQ
ncbi:MAG: hypothetical protein QOJ65_2365, partial [Fimbriimonadaceae bacterium]|nr:hypothetical protein [Fimbriimonadaceae bacterium]